MPTHPLSALRGVLGLALLDVAEVHLLELLGLRVDDGAGIGAVHAGGPRRGIAVARQLHVERRARAACRTGSRPGSPPGFHRSPAAVDSAAPASRHLLRKPSADPPCPGARRGRPAADDRHRCVVVGQAFGADQAGLRQEYSPRLAGEHQQVALSLRLDSSRCLSSWSRRTWPPIVSTSISSTSFWIRISRPVAATDAGAGDACWSEAPGPVAAALQGQKEWMRRRQRTSRPALSRQSGRPGAALRSTRPAKERRMAVMFLPTVPKEQQGHHRREGWQAAPWRPCSSRRRARACLRPGGVPAWATTASNTLPPSR